ncbi:MAG: DNA modification methylase [Sphingomonadaceae bacterium]|nr:DNA modification methylase [Sphingomonadaceae bacterium]
MNKPISNMPALDAPPVVPLPSIGDNLAPKIRHVASESLVLHPDDCRDFSPRDVKRAGRTLLALDIHLPVLIGRHGTVISGQLIALAAKAVGIPYVPVIDVTNLTPLQERMLSEALSKINSLGKVDRAKQRSLLLEVQEEMPNFDLECLALDASEIDLILAEPDRVEVEDEGGPDKDLPAVAKLGDVFQIGDNRIGCGDATDLSAYARLMAGVSASAVFTDPPYGCKIAGFASTRRNRREFVMGSGDMDKAELEAFAESYSAAIASACKPGAIIYICMDWRGFGWLERAAKKTFGPLINLAVWVKDRAGMGSFYRSAHELVLIFARPGGKRRNNVMLGAGGRHRTNVWEYPAALSFSHGEGKASPLAIHATPKPIDLVADAILDSTARGEIVLDPFLGSGTTLIAAAKVARIGYGMDLDPLYVDASIRRLQRWTGLQAVHEQSGRLFDDIEREVLAKG